MIVDEKMINQINAMAKAKGNLQCEEAFKVITEDTDKSEVTFEIEPENRKVAVVKDDKKKVYTYYKVVPQLTNSTIAFVLKAKKLKKGKEYTVLIIPPFEKVEETNS